MIQQKFQNIKKLKINKAKEAFKTVTMSSLNKLLLNMSFNQIKVSIKFNLFY